MSIKYLIVGAERCGTTSLYANITKHTLLPAAYKKEVEFFDRYYHFGKDWYYQQFGGEGIHGEATPTYLWNPLAPQRVYDFNQKMKIIILWPDERESRIRSKYIKQVNKNVEHLSFEDALKYEPIRIKGELERVTGLPYNYYPSMYVEYAYKDRYDERHIKAWNMFKVLLINDFFTADQDEVMARVFDFIGVPFEKYEWEKLNANICVE